MRCATSATASAAEGPSRFPSTCPGRSNAVRRLAYLLSICLLAACGWAAAPAISLDPYIPAARDFSEPLGAVERVSGLRAEGLVEGDGHDHGSAGPITHYTEPIRAPERFDLVGLAGELRALELRARPDGGDWSDWVETADGNPVYFGGAEWVQLRTRGWRPAGRLHYVNVSGTSSTAASVLNGARRALNSALIGAAALVSPAADASAPRPQMVSRRQWGANRSSGGCEPRTRPTYGEVRAGVVHHTVTGNTYSRSEAPGVVLGICRYHRNANGWNDIGYNALTDRFGRIYVGRAGGVARPVVGAHAQGFNAQTAGMAVIGTHTDRPIGERAREAFARFFAWKLHSGRPITGRVVLRSAGGSVSRYPAGRQVRLPRVIGHRDVNVTACPGDRGRNQVGPIRDRAQQIRAGHEAPSEVEEGRAPPRLEITRARLRNERLIVRGSLDPAAAGERLAVRFRAAGTVTVIRAPIGEDGQFVVRRQLAGAQRDARAGRVIVRYAGNEVLRPVRQRVRAAQRAVWLRIQRSDVQGNQLLTVGRVARNAGRAVRIQIRFNRLNGAPAEIVARATVNQRGRFRLNRRVPPAVRKHGAWVAVTHPGRARLHGQRFGRQLAR